MEKERKRHSYTASFKLQVIKYAEKHGNRSAERYFGPPPTEKTIRLWRSQQDVLCTMSKAKRAQRGKSAKWPELETDLWKWVQENSKNGIVISTKMIRKHAVELAHEHNISDFKGAEAWCYRFMKRNSLDPVKRELSVTAIGVNMKVFEGSMDANSLLPSHNIKLEPACETDHVHSSAEEGTIEDQVSDMVDGNLPVRIKVEQPEVEVEHPLQDKRSMDSYNILPSHNIKLEPACETDHDHSSAEEGTIEDQVSDMVDGNLPVRIKVEKSEGEVEYPGQDDKTLNCSQNVPAPTIQEHSQAVCGHFGLKSVKQEPLDVLCVDQYQSLHNMVDMTGCNIGLEMNGHSNTEFRTTKNSCNALQKHENCSQISENASAQPGSSISNDLTDESCQLKRNMDMKTQDKPYISHLNKLKRKCTEDKPFKCDDCDASFTRGSHLKRHKGTHTEDRPYKCDDCGASYTQISNLQSHKRTHTGERPFKCDVCGASFTVADTLNKHKRTHTGERPYQCDDCGASYTRVSHLKIHKRIHTGERPYKCDDCGASFSVADTLNKHKRTHTGEKPYQCDECGASFTVPDSLNKHKRTHRGERPYQCDDCGASYTRISHLKIHKRRHTGERPYKCDECDASFTVADTLNKHKRTHTRKRPYSCDDCAASYTHLRHLKTHKKKHDRETLQV